MGGPGAAYARPANSSQKTKGPPSSRTPLPVSPWIGASLYRVGGRFYRYQASPTLLLGAALGVIVVYAHTDMTPQMIPDPATSRL